MDTSDFYTTACRALYALEKSTPSIDNIGNHIATIAELKSFLESADRERHEDNNRFKSL